MTATCFDDATVLGLVEGRLDPTALAAAEEHLDGCAPCRDLVVALARGSGGAIDGDGVLALGSRLGRYVIGDVLGTGAWGRVYGAWEPELDRRVAIKVLRDATARDRERVVREAQAMARLAHPNVVGVHEVGTADDRVYVAMELVDGKTLRAWATERPAWRPVARAIAEIARGLHAVHAAGLVHRDVKPDNIIVGADGRARLGDFGLAQAHGAPAAVAPTAGTPVYMAPELFDASPATPTSDQFALGVTAYEVLAGRRPFAGETLKALVAAMARDPAAPPHVPRWLAATIARCLARDPAARFPSCDALADHLDRHLARRRPTTLVAGLAAAAILASGATYLATLRTPAAVCELAPFEITAPARADLPAAVPRWIAGWTAAREATCAHPDPAATACLAARAAEAHALLERTAGSLTPERANRLGDALDALPASDCLAISADPRDPTPLDPDRAAIVTRVDRALPDLRAALALGDGRAIAPIATALVATARTADHAPTLAAALLVATAAARETSQLDAASQLAAEAFAAAMRGHAGQLVAEAAVARVAIAGDRRQLALADTLAGIAEAALSAVRAPPHLATQLARQHALVAYNLGDFATARTRLLAARPLATGAELSAIDSALGSTARAAGDLDEADRRGVAALAQDRALHGTSPHPDVARDLHNLAGVARLRGDLAAAGARYREALAIEIALGGATDVEAGLTHNSLGLVALALGDYAAAETELGLARTALAAAHHGDLAFVVHNLGLAAAGRGDPAAAIADFDLAETLYDQTIGDAAPAKIRLYLDRGRAKLAADGPTLALADLAKARDLAIAANIPWIADDSRAAIREIATAQNQARPITLPPPRAGVDQPPAPPAPKRDVGVYGASQTW